MRRGLGDGMAIDLAGREDALCRTRAEARAMIERRHPDGRTPAAPIALAHTLIRVWLEG